MIKILIIIILFSISISNEKTRTFILKNGDKITGELIDEDFNSYVVKTNFGELKINTTFVPTTFVNTIQYVSKIIGR